MFPVDFGSRVALVHRTNSRTLLARKSAATPVVAHPPAAKQTVFSRLSEEEEVANSSLGDMLSNPEEVVGVALTEAAVLQTLHLTILSFGSSFDVI